MCAVLHIKYRPSTKDDINSVAKFFLPNRSITRRNPFASNSESLKGKATCTTQENFPLIWVTTQNIRKCHNGYSYNVYQQNTICKDSNLIIHMGIAELEKQLQESTIAMSIEKVVQGYNNSGFKVCNILVDGQYEHIRQIMEDKGVNGNICM